MTQIIMLGNMNMPLTSHNDAFTFYACAISSFLESRADTYVENLEPFFQCDANTLNWLKDVWLPEESDHGRLMRAYVQNTWTDFDWERGFREFSERYIPQCSTTKLRPNVSLEALARCVTETQATMIYRCIGNYTQDTSLRTLLKRMSTDEVRHYRKFRDIHRSHEMFSQTGFMRKVRTLLQRNVLARKEDLALSFAPLNSSWKQIPPFELLSYPEFIRHAGEVMKVHFPFDEAKRMLFHPLKMDSIIGRMAVNVIARLAYWQFARNA